LILALPRKNIRKKNIKLQLIEKRKKIPRNSHLQLRINLPAANNFQKELVAMATSELQLGNKIFLPSSALGELGNNWELLE
jgi:hypothetical protein